MKCSSIKYDSNIIGVGIFITIGIILTYIPQFLKIIKTRSTFGISIKMIFIGNIANFANLFGTFMSDWSKISCCSEVSSKLCGATIVPLFQMASPWLCMFVLYVIYLYYYREEIHYYYEELIRYFHIYLGTILIITVSGVIVLLALPSNSSDISEIGDVFNIISVVFCIIQWIPQITTTYKYKEIGSISLLALAMQVPGSFLVFGYQDAMINSRFSVGMPYLFAGIQQLILLIMGMFYEFSPKYNGRRNRLLDNYEYSETS